MMNLRSKRWHEIVKEAHLAAEIDALNRAQGHFEAVTCYICEAETFGRLGARNKCINCQYHGQERCDNRMPRHLVQAAHDEYWGDEAWVYDIDQGLREARMDGGGDVVVTIDDMRVFVGHFFPFLMERALKGDGPELVKLWAKQIQKH